MTLRDLYSSRGYQSYTESKLGNDLFINDPDRADRIQNAADNGCDGSTHAEVIEDWREYLGTLKITDEDGGDISQEDFTEEGFGYPVFKGEGSTERAFEFAEREYRKVAAGVC